MTTSNEYAIHIRKRPWWYWLVAVVWLALVLFFLNFGLASSAELEPQATLIAYVIAVVLIIVGIAGYLFERKKAK